MVEETHAPALRRRRRRATPAPPVYLESISVSGLFGKLSYPTIPLASLGEENRRISVLYGDNGSGKTTILRMIYACLSPQSRAGLRTLVARTPFHKFQVRLTDGTVVNITKTDLIGGYSVELTQRGTKSLFEIVANSDGDVQQTPDIDNLEAALTRLDLDILFVDHNRVVQSTYSFISDSMQEEGFFYDDPQIGRVYHTREAIRAIKKGEDFRIPLPEVVNALEARFRSEAYKQGAEGEQNAAAVYLDIAKTLNRDRRRVESRYIPEIRDVLGTLENLKASSHSFIRHGLMSEYPFDEFINIYKQASKAKKAKIEAVIIPFLDSIQRRINSLNGIHRSITVFEQELDQYFKRKSVQYHILYGLTISDENGDLDLDYLSSGEKQLIFLLSAAAVSRARRSIILIDEPELSLNYKWQRLIVGSLSKISLDSQTQFLLASHSIEIITRYVGSSFELAD